jgi:trk system potassium uptake protein TrkA
MNIIIIGAGKMGLTLVRQLSKEGHNIVVVDNNKKVVEKTVNDFDVMGIYGNGADHEIQTEAKTQSADLLIACTSTDEFNILCCMVAKKLNAEIDTIARVRNPEYFTLFMSKELGLNMMVNPDYEAAMEIFRILRSPGTIKIEPFSGGKVDLVEFKLAWDNPLIDTAISDLTSKLQIKTLICAVQRDEEVIIPKGDFIFRENDKIHIIASPKDAHILMKKLGIFKSVAKKVMIIGGSRIAFYLAKQLDKIGIAVKIVEKNEQKAMELSESLDQAEIIIGDGSDRQVLQEEWLMNAGAVIILTGSDEENIMISLFAGSQKVNKVITKINRLSYYSMLEASGIESIISPHLLTANQIIRYVRGKQNSMGSSVLNLYRIVNDQAEALEFLATKTFAGLSKPLKALSIKPNLIIACILRDNNVITPHGDQTIEAGDKVIVVTTNEFLDDLNDILN